MIIDNKEIELNSDILKKESEISFSDSIAVNEIVDIIKKVNDIEIESGLNIFINLKPLNIQKVQEILSSLLKCDRLSNASIIFNIILLLKTYNTLEDEFFNNKNVYYSSLEDFLDIKNGLKSNIKELNTKLSIYFISIFRSLNKFEFSFIDNPVQIPELYKNILLSVDVFTIGGILSNNNGFTDKDMLMIKDSYGYVSEITSKIRTTDMLFGSLMEQK